jgi:hypothetical protein
MPGIYFIKHARTMPIKSKQTIKVVKKLDKFGFQKISRSFGCIYCRLLAGRILHEQGKPPGVESQETL